MDIEKLATSAVIDSISSTDLLSPYINDTDKEPSWDGYIYIYKSKRKSKKGLKRVPVQVKGKTVKKLPHKNPTFPVSMVDLDNWLNDGGIILFVVYIDCKGKKKIYYNGLVPVRIRKYKE